MRYMLDTNICIYLIKHFPPEVAQHFAQCAYGKVVMSAITYTELWHSVQASEERKMQNQTTLLSLIEDILVLPFAGAEQFGRYRTLITSRKVVLDCIIAAHAFTENCILVTNNEQGFVQFSDLIVENWVKH
jgi:tRNA(fMet)-specific endonuclease VapC